jgi:hypothetical protein
MSEEDQEVLVGPPLPGGDYWKFTRRAADSLDAAKLEILHEAEPDSAGQAQPEEED